jgi:hypothetical protein
MPVSPANQKKCVQCGADLTFAQRSQDSKGRYHCLRCAKASATSLGAVSTSKAHASAASADNRLSPANRTPLAAAQPTTFQQPKAQSDKSRGAGGQTTRQKQIIFWIIGGGIALVVVVSACLFLLRPTWEEQNRAQIITMKTDADDLLQHGQAEAAYARYKELFAFVGDHEVHGDFIKTELAIAKSGMEHAYATAAPLIEKEEAEEREKAAEQQRIADERRAAELAQQQKEEADRQRQAAERASEKAQAEEKDRVAREAAAQRAIRETARVLFLKSDEFADWKRKADSTVTDLNSYLIAEDSAYRGLSKEAAASRNLLGLYIKAEGRLLDKDVDASVDRILSDADTNLITEDSAIVAIYENDKAFFELLGRWCVVLDTRNTSLEQTFDGHDRAALMQGIGDDSAPRAMDRYSDASMRVLQAIVSEQGLGAKAHVIISDVQMQNVGDDSAWRVAMRNEEANMRLLLLLVAEEDPATASKMEADATNATIGDDSALRAQQAYYQGKVDALHWLVCHP